MITKIAIFGYVAALASGLIFMAFNRDDTTLIQFMSAAGTVMAGGFTALAAFAAMTAARESNTTASRAKEALARITKPSVSANVSTDNNDRTKALGSVSPGSDQGAIDLKVVWYLRDGRKVTERIGALIPEPTGRNPHLPHELVLGEWRGSPSATVQKVEVEYSDVSKLMRWRLTRRFMSDQEWREEGYEPPDTLHLMPLDHEEPLG